MDNETPKYANWIPSAGGYVADGKVVSKSPQYDEGGKLKLDVDASLFTPQTSNAQVANNTATNVGITTANTTGSKQDVNSMTTNIGANTSLNLNTDNPLESVLSSPATKSPVAGSPILTIEDQINQEYLDAAARNDIQGMINALTAMGNYNGQDYSAEIERLTLQRQEKIRNIDDQFLASYDQARSIYNQALRNYNMAVQSKDEKAIAQAEAELSQAESQMLQIAQEQTTWRDQVGYSSAMAQAKQRDLEQADLLWKNKYLDTVDQIADSVLQLTGNFINFQYDPTTDAKLQRAQSYTLGTMTEHFSNTGMYDSSSVAYAMTSAVAQLVPIYEQMAKDELKDSITMLQNTANFLMNLEESQFSMWKSQVELQWKANEQKRQDFYFAVDKSNARGWVNNEEAAILGVEPGSLSQEAREHEQALQEQIEKEQRALQQDMIMADYNQTLQLQRMEEQNRINKDYAAYEYGLKQRYYDYTNRSTGGGSSDPYAGYTYEKDYGNGLKVKLTGRAAIEAAMEDGVDVSSMFNGSTGETTLNSIEDYVSKYKDQMVDEDGNYDPNKVKDFLLHTWKTLDQDTGTLELEKLYVDYIERSIDDISKSFGSKAKTTENAVTSAKSLIDEFASTLERAGVKPEAVTRYKDKATNYLVDAVNADSDINYGWFSNTDTSKEKAVNAITGNNKKEEKQNTDTSWTKPITGNRIYVSASDVKTSHAPLNANTKYIEVGGQMIPVERDTEIGSGGFTLLDIAQDAYLQSQGLSPYYYISTLSGTPTRKYVDMSQVKTVGLTKGYNYVNTSNGKIPVQKDEKTGKWYYIEY